MDETLPLLELDDLAADAPPATWPQAAPRASAQLLDCEEWFSEEHALLAAGGGEGGGDLP